MQRYQLDLTLRRAEGALTRVRAHLVREDSLHRAALGLGLPQVLRLSEGEARGGGAQRLGRLEQH